MKYDTEDPVETAKLYMKRIPETKARFLLALRPREGTNFKIDFVKAVAAIVKQNRPGQDVQITEVERASPGPVETIPAQTLREVIAGVYAQPVHDGEVCGQCDAKQTKDGGTLHRCGRCKYASTVARSVRRSI